MNKKIQINFFCKSNHWSRRMVKIKEIAQRVIKIDDLNFKKNNFYALNLVFVDDKNIKKINKEYRKKNKPTDVLTFVNSVKNNKNVNETYCDILFSAETIKKDAKKNITNFSIVNVHPYFSFIALIAYFRGKGCLNFGSDLCRWPRTP